jgi:hypothetical protein
MRENQFSWKKMGNLSVLHEWVRKFSLSQIHVRIQRLHCLKAIQMVSRLNVGFMEQSLICELAKL